MLSFNIANFNDFLICTVSSLVLGFIIACVHMFRASYSKGFITTLALLPATIQVVIMLVNGNLGTGVAVMGAFSLIRFRSAPGGAKEIGSIFLSMAVGLATGVGYIGIAVLFTFILGGVNVLYNISKFGETSPKNRELKITIPEELDYIGVFTDIFKKYTEKHEVIGVKTANMGSVYKLNYDIILKDVTQEKSFIDELRCRNGNLDIICNKHTFSKDEL